MKKYIAILLVVVSCLFAFSGCGKDDYSVDIEKHNPQIVVEYLSVPFYDVRISIDTPNNAAVAILLDISCFDENNNFISKVYTYSDFFVFLENNCIVTLSAKVPTNTKSVTIDLIQMKKSHFDSKYHVV